MDYLFLLNHLITFILMLYGNPALPRKIVDIVIDFIQNFIAAVYLPSLKKDVLEALKDENISGFSLFKLNQCFERHSKIFDAVSTEPKRFNLLRRKGYVDPQEFDLGFKFTEKLVGNDILLVPKTMKVPLRNSLKLFLEIPGLFGQILGYMRNLSKESYIISNIIQSNLWSTVYSDITPETILLPLFIFYDDLEVGNPLGSHAGVNKFGAVYALIGCLPPNIASRLKSILFSTLVHISDKKKAVMKKSLQSL